jgi:two-component system CheB/CheR fusion protein
MEPYATQRVTKNGKIVDIWMTATALINKNGVYAIATTERLRDANNLPRQLDDA